MWVTQLQTDVIPAIYSKIVCDPGSLELLAAAFVTSSFQIGPSSVASNLDIKKNRDSNCIRGSVVPAGFGPQNAAFALLSFNKATSFKLLSLKGHTLNWNKNADFLTGSRSSFRAAKIMLGLRIRCGLTSSTQFVRRLLARISLSAGDEVRLHL